MLVWRKSTKNTSERVFGQESVASSVAGETPGKSKIRISIIVEVRDVQFATESPHNPSLPGNNRGNPSPGKERKRGKPSSPLLSSKKFSLADSPPSLGKRTSLEEDPKFVAVLDKYFQGAGTQKSGRDGNADPIL